MSGVLRRKVKWCDFTRGSYKEEDAVLPIFLFDERRGSKLDLITFEYSPPQATDDDLVSYIRQGLQPATLGKVIVRDFLGHPYIAMEWRDRRYFWPAMEVFLARGISVSPQCRLTGFWFPPEALVRPWVPLVAEHVIVRMTRQEIEQGPFTARDLKHFCYSHPGSWLTREGEELVRWLRVKQRNAPDPSSSDEELPVDEFDTPEEVSLSTTMTTTPIVEDVVLERRSPRPSDTSAVVKVKSTSEAAPVKDPVHCEVENTETTCVVCLVNRADTLVLPCQHQVCCRACSLQLKTTPNAHVCIICRRQITDVLMDD